MATYEINVQGNQETLQYLLTEFRYQIHYVKNCGSDYSFKQQSRLDISS